MNPKGPIIGITMGDAAGIGPEVIAKALDRPEVYGFCRPVVIGDAKRMQKAAQIAKVSAKVKTVAGPSEAGFRHGTIDTIDVGGIPEDLPFGKLSPVAGDGAYRFIAKAVEGAAKLLGNTAAMKALKEGEERGIKDYEKALHEGNLAEDCQAVNDSR